MRRDNTAWSSVKSKLRKGAVAAALGATVLSGGCTVNHHFSSRPPMTEESREARLIRALRQGTVVVRTDEARGSGIIISQDEGRTVILTNRHVVDPESEMSFPSGVRVSNNSREFDVERIMVAPDGIDLAVIVIDGSVGPPVRSGRRRPVVGTSVYVVGSPLGSEDSVTSGIVSNFRSTRTEGGFEFDAIQTDAAVNPGNSGGGVFDADTGELLGVISFKLMASPYESAEGMAFAIPVEVFRRTPYSDWQRLTRES